MEKLYNYPYLIKMADTYGDMVKKCLDEKAIKTLGDKALTLLGDYPLYSATSNITYEQAISLALVLFGDINEAYKDYCDWRS